MLLTKCTKLSREGFKNFTCPRYRALCRITLLPVTHVLVNTWMLTVKPVYKLLNVFYDLKWATNTHMTPFTFTLTFKAYITISLVLEDFFFFSFMFYPSNTFLHVHIHFYPSKLRVDRSLHKAMPCHGKMHG